MRSCRSTNGSSTGDVTNTYCAIKDIQSTVHALVDENGIIVERYEYDAWGRTKIYSADGTELTESAIGNRYLFQGREYDASTGLYYFRARWYDPVSGRFISKDPVGISGGLNLYVFCSDDPVNFVDPLGLFDLKKLVVEAIVAAMNQWGPLAPLSKIEHAGIS